MRKPSPATINLYNRLMEQQNKVRKILRRIHKNAEETHGAGRLPALVIPKPARKVRPDNFNKLSKAELQRRLKAFNAKLAEAKRLFGQGLRSYIARTVKDGYMELWKDQILFASGESPEGNFGKFSKEQIEGSYMGAYMEVFNMLQSMSPEMFLALLYTDKIIQFKYIYQDIISGTGEKENSWLQQQKDILEIYRSRKEQYRLLNSVEEIEPLVNHTKDTIKKSEERYNARRNK